MYLIVNEISGMRAIKRLHVDTVMAPDGTLTLSSDGLWTLAVFFL